MHGLRSLKAMPAMPGWLPGQWHVRILFRAYRQLHRFHDLCQVGWTPKSHNLMPWLGSQRGPVTGAAKQAFFQCRIRKFLHGRTNHCSLLWVLQMLILHFHKFMGQTTRPKCAFGANSQGLKFLWKIMFNPWTLLEFHAGIIQNRTSGENHPK